MVTRRQFAAAAAALAAVGVGVLGATSGGGSVDVFVGSTPTPTGTATATPTPTATPGAQSCPAFPEFPDADCTGVPAGTSLTAMTSAAAEAVLATPGGTITARDISGCVDVVGHSGTIQNSKVKCIKISFGDPAGDTGNPKFLIKDSEINCGGIPRTEGGENPGIDTVNFHVLRVEITHCSDGAFADNDAIIEDSYIHDMAWDSDPEGIHVDGIQAVGGTNVSITHNRIVVFDAANGCTISTDTNGSCNGSSAITSNNASGLPAIDNWHVEYNLIGGGQATIYCSLPSATNSTIQHNRFMSAFNPGTGGEVGAVADCGNDGNGATTDETYSDNLWYDGADAGDAVPES